LCLRIPQPGRTAGFKHQRGYLGPELTLSTFGPLLKSKSLNPKATLLALSLNAIHEEESYGGNVIASLQSNKERMCKYLAKLARVRSLRRLAKGPTQSDVPLSLHHNPRRVSLQIRQRRHDLDVPAS
jgi:hypothetical protein